MKVNHNTRDKYTHNRSPRSIARTALALSPRPAPTSLAPQKIALKAIVAFFYVKFCRTEVVAF